jgi:hypothetical protein
MSWLAACRTRRLLSRLAIPETKKKDLSLSLKRGFLGSDVFIFNGYTAAPHPYPNPPQKGVKI